MKSIKKLTILLPLIVVCMMILGVQPVSAASSDFLKSSSDAGITVTGGSEWNLKSDGTIREADLTLKKSNGTTVGAHVVLVKANAKAKFKPVIPNYYTSGSTKSGRVSKSANWTNWGLTGVTNMVRQYQSAADTNKTVYAAINGDFGIGSKPRGSLIMEGGYEIGASSAYEDEYFFGHKSTTGTLNILGRTSSQKSTFDEAICGGAHILRNGALFGLDNETVSRQRTGIGIKTNGDTILVCVESGITVKQLAQLLRDSGCWNAINMDGGGSITMVTKRTSDSNTKLRTPYSGYADVDGNGERMICSALMLVDDSTVVNNVGTVSGNSITTDKSTYNVGDDIYVTASSANDGSWVSILRADDAVSAGEYFWYYTYGNSGSTWCWENGTKNNIYAEGMCSLRDGVTAETKLPPGRYRAAIINYNSAGNYQELASKYFTIESDDKTPYALSTNKSVYTVGEQIMVTGTNPSSDTGAWVGIVKSGRSIFDGDGGASYFWDYVSEGGAAFSLLDAENMIAEENYNELASDEQAMINRDKVCLNPGTYDIIMLTYGGYSVAYGADGKPVKKTITVIESDQEYTITYKDGSSNLSGLSPTKYKMTESQSGAIALPTSVTKTGYNFAGWYDNASFSGSKVTSIPKNSTGHKVYYAKFTKQSYTVTFHSQGKTWAEAQVEYGNTVAKPANPTRTGYDFAGWVTTSGGSTAFNFGTAIKANTTVYASWKPTTYSITFDEAGGAAVNDMTYTIESANFNLPTTTKEGHNFMYWQDANGKTYSSIPKGTTGNLKLTAQWRNTKVFSMDKVEFAYGESIKITTYYDTAGGWVGLFAAGEEPGNVTPILKFAVPAAGTTTDITDKSNLDAYQSRPEAWYPQTNDFSGNLKSGSYLLCVMNGAGVLQDATIITIQTEEYDTRVTAPTCTTGGFTTTYYTDGTEKKFDETEAFGHSSGEEMDCEKSYVCVSCKQTIAAGKHVSSGDATCTDPEICTVCQKVLTPSKGHQWKDATCTEAKTCEVCKDTVGAPLGHDWAMATCTKAMECKTCHTTEGEPLGHAWVSADCFTPKTCHACGETDGEKGEHTWNEGVVTKAPTCTEDGVRTFSCTLCRKVEMTKPEPKTDHNFKETVVAPTCKKDGYTLYECINRRCDYTYVKEDFNTACHTPGAAPTCQTPQICTECNVVLEETTAHTPGAEPTCTDVQECTVCHRVLKAALGHTPAKNVACTEDLICTTCHDVLVEATGHTPGKKATCTTSQNCLDCGAVLKEELGHKPGDAATCLSPQTCTVCDVVLEKVTDHKAGPAPTCTTAQHCVDCNVLLKSAKGHTPKTLPAVAATCTTTGLTEGQICKDCGYVLSSQTATAMLPHTATETKGTPATMTADGKLTHLCGCGLEMSTETVYSAETVKLSAAAMVYNGKVKNPTVIVKDSKGNAISSDYYTVSIPSGRKTVGTYTYKVTFKGNYEGTADLKLTVKPAKPTILAPKAAKKAVTVKWKKATTQKTGYQVMVATDKKFKKNKKSVHVKGAKLSAKKISGLKAKKTYFVKVRAYKTVKGVKIYSNWSKIKTIKTK